MLSIAESRHSVEDVYLELIEDTEGRTDEHERDPDRRRHPRSLEFRRNRFILITAAILPIVFLISPTVSILALKASAVSTVLEKRVQTSLFLPLLIPVFVPALLSSYAVVGEREQGTLEPVLTTPVSAVEFLLGKATAIFMPRWASPT